MHIDSLHSCPLPYMDEGGDLFGSQTDSEEGKDCLFDDSDESSTEEEPEEEETYKTLIEDQNRALEMTLRAPDEPPPPGATFMGKLTQLKGEKKKPEKRKKSTDALRGKKKKQRTPAGFALPTGTSFSLELPKEAPKKDITTGIVGLNELLHPKKIETPSSLPPPPDYSIENAGLPPEVAEKYVENGICALFKWQYCCLHDTGALDGDNLVYCAPTSGGKTLVSEVLMARRLVRKKKKKIIFVVPYVAIATEKAATLQALFEPLNVVVGTQAAGVGNRLLLDDVAICTIERANSIVNTILDMGRMDEISMVIVDELHQIAETERGYLLEMFLTKMLYSHHTDLQIVGMSATLPNAASLAAWLKDAWFFATDYRPVPLQEWYCTDGKLHNGDQTTVRTIGSAGSADHDRLISLTMETVKEGHSVLIFCPTKKLVETTALRIAKYMSTSTSPMHSTPRSTAIEMLKTNPCGPDPILEFCIPYGVAYHHAGLTFEEREVVERCYRETAIQVLTCTTTLAAGVNLPSRRVIFLTAKIGIDRIDATRYKQAAGRAGRVGLDVKGESILLGKPGEVGYLTSLITGKLPKAASSLASSKRGMTRAIGEAIASGVTATVYDVRKYANCTFLREEKGEEEVGVATTAALEFLERNDFVTYNAMHGVYKPTMLAKATFKSGLSPHEAKLVYEDLDEARNHFVMSSDMHLIFHCTPYVSGIEPDWSRFYGIFLNLPPDIGKVARLVGVNEGVLALAQHQRPDDSTRSSTILRRFWCSLILVELVKEAPLDIVSKRFRVPRGNLQRLMSSAASFASMVASFAEHLNWWGFAPLIQKLQSRLRSGIEADLVPLMQIPSMKSYRARAFYQAGLRTVESVAVADSGQVEALVAGSHPFVKKGGVLKNFDSKIGKSIVREAQTLLLKSAKEKEAELRSVEEKIKEIKASQENTAKKKRISVGSGYGQKLQMNETVNNVGKNSILNRLDLETLQHNRKRGAVTVRKITEGSISYSIVVLNHNNHGSDEEARFLSSLKAAHRCGFSFSGNTTGLDSTNYGIAVCFDSNLVYYYVLHDAQGAHSDPVCTERLNVVANFLKSKQIHVKASYDCKSQVKWCLKSTNIKCPVNLMDPRIAAWMLMPDDKFEGSPSNTLEVLTRQFLKTTAPQATAPSDFKEAGCKAAVQSLVLMRQLIDSLKQNDLLAAFKTLEMPFVSVLSGMETLGVRFDKNVFSRYNTAMDVKATELAKKACEITGYNWSMTCPAQCARALFDNQGLPEVVVRKVVPTTAAGRRSRPTESRSTSASILAKLHELHPDNPLPLMIKEHRLLVGWLTKYIRAIPMFAGASDRVHAVIFQTATNTGRLAMIDPNLQTIPRPVQFSSVSGATIDLELRKAFVAPPHHVLISADYSQIEVRIMAHFSEDKAMLDFLTLGGDVFRNIASKVRGKHPDSVTPAERKVAKAICYGILYGKGALSLSEDLNCTREEAEIFLRDFKNTYTGITKYITSVAHGCRSTGYVETLLGRKRYLPAIYSRNPKEKAFAERAAVNTICQGSAADIVKKAMIALYARIPHTEARLVLQIHDELLFEVREDKLQETIGTIRGIMENEVSLRVTLPVNIQVGRSWGELGGG